MSKIEFDRIDLTDLIIVVALSVGLLMAVFTDQKELSMSIVSGMFGYVGGSYTKQSSKANNNSNNIQQGTTKTTTTNTNTVSTITRD